MLKILVHMIEFVGLNLQRRLPVFYLLYMCDYIKNYYKNFVKVFALIIVGRALRVFNLRFPNDQLSVFEEKVAFPVTKVKNKEN